MLSTRRPVSQIVMWAVVCAALAACQAQRPDSQGGTPTVVQLTGRDNGQAVTLQVGQSLEIDLDENASTGYTWTIDTYDSSILESLGSTPSYSSGPVGSAGRVTFSFKAIAAGTGPVRLKNWRAWEGDSSVVDRFETTVTVTQS